MLFRLLTALRSVAVFSMAMSAAAYARAEGVSPKAQVLIGQEGSGFPLTNAMITCVVATLAIILLFRWLVGRPKLVPSRGQAVVESLLEGLRGLLEPIIGKKAMPAAFPVLITLFLFILLNNWSGLLPFVGTVGLYDHHGHFAPLIRPPTSDFNGTVALALFSFGAWLIIVLKYAGPKTLFFDLFGNKADKKETPAALYWSLSLIFLAVGVIEIVSIFIRPVTLSARLFGNIYGGEALLHNTSFFFGFYFLELLVGLVQAFVFTLLSAVYIGLICNHGDDHDHAEGHAEASH